MHFLFLSMNISSLLSQYTLQILSTFVASGNPFRTAVGAHTQTPVPALQALPELMAGKAVLEQRLDTAKGIK